MTSPGDAHEREADAVAERVMRRMPAGGITGAPAVAALQRSAGDTAPATAPPSVDRTLAGTGQPIAPEAKRILEPRFGRDFSGVRLHVDAAAAASAEEIGARAYTVGRDIAFAAGEYAPGSTTGLRLLAHELTHVVQQGAGAGPVVQRSCSDENFCKPYDTVEEAESAEWWVRNTYFRMEGLETYGSEVKGLYESFLDRSPGDSLDPVVFNDEGSYLVSSFRGSGDTKDDMDAVIGLVGERLSQSPAPLRDGSRVTMSLSNFLSDAEMKNRPINYSNPFSVAGHIAGGIGSSDAGDDYRSITSANVTLEKSVLVGSTGYVSVELTPHYEVFDAIDFCPGDCGSPAEQLVTIPMSRLEASGAAYDVPFKVVFIPEARSERFWF
jgi:hypothetical protein